MSIDVTVLEKLMRLAYLAPVADDTSQAQKRALKNLNEALSLIQQMNAVDTKGVEPMAHPLDIVQPLREDKVQTSVDREALQKGAPELRDGFYTVPRVVEEDSER